MGKDAVEGTGANQPVTPPTWEEKEVSHTSHPESETAKNSLTELGKHYEHPRPEVSEWHRVNKDPAPNIQDSILAGLYGESNDDASLEKDIDAQQLERKLSESHLETALDHTPFADSDVLVVSDEAYASVATPPLNWIGKSEFEYICALFKDLQSGTTTHSNTRIQIKDVKDPNFKEQVLDHLKVLITRPSGRRLLLILSIKASATDSLKKIEIRPTNKGPSAEPADSRGHAFVNWKLNPSKTEGTTWSVLAHELIHVLHGTEEFKAAFPEEPVEKARATPAAVTPLGTNREEERTIGLEHFSFKDPNELGEDWATPDESRAASNALLISENTLLAEHQLPLRQTHLRKPERPSPLDPQSAEALDYLLNHAARGNIEEVQELLDLGVARGKFQRVASRAAIFNQPGILKLLIERGYKLSPNPESGNTPVHLAARDGAIDALEFLLTLPEGRECLTHKNHDGHSPFFLAASPNIQARFKDPTRKSAMEILAQASVPDFTEVNEMKQTLLEQAISKNNLSLARFLLQHGAPVDYAPEGMSPPLLTALLDGKEPFLLLFLEKASEARTWSGEDGQSLLHASVRFGSPRSIGIISQKIPALVNRVDIRGRTPLHLIAQSLAMSIFDGDELDESLIDSAKLNIQALVDAGVDINAEDSEGHGTMLDYLESVRSHDDENSLSELLPFLQKNLEAKNSKSEVKPLDFTHSLDDEDLDSDSESDTYTDD